MASSRSEQQGQAAARAPAPRADNFALGFAFLTLSMFLFAVMDALSRILVATYPVPMILWIRFAFFLLFAAIMIGPSGIGAALRTRIPWLQTGRSVALIFEIGIFILAFRYLPIADVHAVAASTPLIILIFAAALLGERVRLSVWIAVTVGFLGVLLIVRPGLREFEWFHVIPVVGAISWGFYQVLVRLVGRSDSASTTLLWSGLVGFAATSFVGPLFWVHPDLAGAGLLIVSGALGAFAHWTLIKAYEACAIARLQPYNYTLVLWAVIAGFVMLGEFPDLPTLVGAGIVIAAGIYTWLAEVRRQRAAVR
jgi:drug/metabolite transporter (DMT)-like permease